MSFSNFLTLDPSVRDVASGLLADADQNHPPSFMSFTYRWMAFNGWMSCVTLQDQDWKIINAIAAEPRLGQAHADLMATDAYRENVQHFASLWPILNVRDVRKKLGFDAFRTHSRAELLAIGVPHQPEAWLPAPSQTGTKSSDRSIRFDATSSTARNRRRRSGTGDSLSQRIPSWARSFLKPTASTGWIYEHGFDLVDH